ncbi:uncharacterized protein LOC118648783 [Monomorium pharaonis]|uniref:uncharacterized protein LOC118648783 n=1 Tax=Monomorium pharaonis TaxID=307658 RepID=UPI001746276A|nr:uncharacterized protein LOC118648783 [Monomorium pharaonis]
MDQSGSGASHSSCSPDKTRAPLARRRGGPTGSNAGSDPRWVPDIARPRPSEVGLVGSTGIARGREGLAFPIVNPCVMENCKNIFGQMLGLSFFRFLRDSERAQLWLRNCGRTIDKSTENLYKNYRVCGDHFEDTMFLNNLKNRLQPHAIPTATNANANISNNKITFSNSKGKSFILI